MISGALRRVGVWVVAASSLLVATGCDLRPVNIAGEAMAPTLMDGQRVAATRKFTALSRGDVVGLRYPKDESKSFVKRIIGLPGDRIEMSEGVVSINGQVLTERYVVESNRSRESWGPITVAQGHYFVMGDNRRNSSDSRAWGQVRRDAIWAKLIIP